MVGSTAVPADSTKALKYLRKSAEENNPIGQTGLALAYLYGRAGLPVKPVIAMELFLKAADQGWPEAQLHLGRLFLGNGKVANHHIRFIDTRCTGDFYVYFLKD